MEKDKIKILLVDDEPDIIEILSYNLKKEGYQVFSASNGEEALVQVEKVKPHLIILDVMMPVMDGIETCEIIRKDKRHLETIIMFLSARSEDYSHVAAFDVGADDYVNKPFTGDDLKIPIHYMNRDHGWSTTKFKKLISESYEKSNHS